MTIPAANRTQRFQEHNVMEQIAPPKIAVQICFCSWNGMHSNVSFDCFVLLKCTENHIEINSKTQDNLQPRDRIEMNHCSGLCCQVVFRTALSIFRSLGSRGRAIHKAHFVRNCITAGVPRNCKNCRNCNTENVRAYAIFTFELRLEPSIPFSCVPLHF